MATTYATSAQLTSWAQDQRLPSDTALIASVLEAASRSIDHYCNRTFERETTARAELARAVRPLSAERPVTTGTWASLDGVVTPSSGITISTDDFYSQTDLVVEVGTLPWGAWTTVDPGDVLVDTRVDPDHPYTRIFVRGHRAEYARVTARYGWNAVPDAVQIACLVAALSSMRRRYSPDGQPSVDGVSGTPIVADLAPASKRNLAPYRRWTVG